MRRRRRKRRRGPWACEGRVGEAGGGGGGLEGAEREAGAAVVSAGCCPIH